MATTLTLNGGMNVKERNPLGVVGLTMLTFGIYFFYWYYAVNKELADAGEEVKPVMALLAVTFGGLVIVPWIMSMYNTAQRIQNVQKRAGVTSEINPVIAAVILFTPVGIFYGPYAQQSLNGAWLAMADTSSAPTSSTPAV